MWHAAQRTKRSWPGYGGRCASGHDGFHAGLEILRIDDFIVLQILPTGSIVVYSGGRFGLVVWEPWITSSYVPESFLTPYAFTKQHVSSRWVAMTNHGHTTVYGGLRNDCGLVYDAIA